MESYLNINIGYPSY